MTKKDRWQTHVYLTEDDFLRLKQIAEKESRSTTMQIEYFLRQAIADYGEVVRPRPEKGGRRV